MSKKRKRDFSALIPLGVVLVVFLVIGGCVRWRWNECRKVGHGFLYCVLSASK
jgi:hypothetical protein